MRKIIFSLLTLLATQALFAQDVVNIKFEGDSVHSYPMWKIKSIEFGSDVEPTTKVAEAVDLGLSVKWASWNIGAEKADDKGLTFGWGNKFASNHSTSAKYFPSPSPKANIIDGDYDIAKGLWGSEWRMPSDRDFAELLDKEKTTWTWDATRNGYTVTSLINGNSIFLPAAGHRYGEIMSNESEGFYWTGVIDKTNKSEASNLWFSNETALISSIAREYGLLVRPVFGAYTRPVDIADVKVDVNGNNVTFRVTVAGEGQDVEYGIIYGVSTPLDQTHGNKLTPYKDTFTEQSVHTFYLFDLNYMTKYYYRPYAKIGEEYVMGEVGTIDIDAKYPVPEVVDLGLGVKWASWNIGASRPEDYGIYSYWGDTTGNASSFTAPSNSQIGIEDYSGTSFDLAHNVWGGEWRLPNSKEIEELLKLCTIESETVNGTYCIKVTGPNGNYIYLPKTGYIDGNGAFKNDYKVWIWSSEYDAAKGIGICGQMTSSQYLISGAYREQRNTFRAVYGEYDASNIVNPKPGDNGGDVTPGTGEGGDNPGTGGGNTGDEEFDEPIPDEPVIVIPSDKDTYAVDLGLSVDWSSVNLGAATPDKSGDYYAWGCTEPAQYFLETEYKYFDRTETVYNTDGTVKGTLTYYRYPEAGMSNIKGTAYDAAHVAWGGSWRMPTRLEVVELVNNCTFEDDWVKDQKVCKITSKKNGNSITIPYAGLYTTGSNIGFINTSANFWTAESTTPKDASKEVNMSAYILEIWNGTPSHESRGDRWTGIPIRPVRAK